MCKDGSVLLHGEQELGFVIDSQVASISGCKAIHPMLAKNCGERNRNRFVEVESHRADLALMPESSASCSAISRSIASR